MKRHTKGRPGFTLFELVVVMMLIIIIAAISVPVLQTMLTDSRITSAGDAVRARVADTRAKALEDGRPWKLACITNTGWYQLAPEDSTDWGNSDQFADERMDLMRDQLPTEIVFSMSHEGIMNSTEAGSPGSGWETIVVFMPDGSARDDSVVYFGRPGVGPMRVRIRGLTGAVSLETFTQIRGSQ